MSEPPHSLQQGALLAAIRDLQRRVSWLERQHRMLCTAIAFEPDHPPQICRDTRCLAGPVPHLAEQPDLCPILEAK